MYWLLWYQMPFLCLTVNVIHVHCWLTDTGATVAAAKLTSFCLLSYRFIIAEQTSQRSATEIEPQRPSASDQSPPQPRTQETKRESKEARGRDGEREGGNSHKPSHVSARATCFTYETHLSPFNSHEIVQEEVIAKGGRGGSDVERLEGPLQRIPHYTLVTALEYYPCENTLSPLGG